MTTDSPEEGTDTPRGVRQWLGTRQPPNLSQHRVGGGVQERGWRSQTTADRVARLLRSSHVAAVAPPKAPDIVTGGGRLVVSSADQPVAPAVAPSIAIFLPAFNEAANISRTVQHALDALGAVASSFSVIVVDDGSTDGTGEIVADLVRDHSDKVIAVGHVRNRGYGAALQTGFAAGLRTGHEWIGFVDADGQFDLGELGLFFDAARVHEARFVAGYRMARADRWTRRQLGHAWDGLSGRIVQHGLRDVDCGFKIVHRDILRGIKLRGTYASISPELAAKARRAGTTIAQVGVTHYPRTGGAQTGANVKVVVRSLRGLIDLRREMAAETV